MTSRERILSAFRWDATDHPPCAIHVVDNLR